MRSSNFWLQLLAYLRDSQVPPFRFVHGMRHQVPQGVCCSVHAHRELEIVYHPRGGGVTRLDDGAEVRFDEGGVILYASDQAHDQVMDSPGEDAYFQLEMPPVLRQGLKGCLYLPPPLGPLLTAELDALTHVRILPEGHERTIMSLRGTAVLISLVQTAFASEDRESMPRTERHVNEAESYLRDHFQTIGSLEEVAQHVGISHDRLRHLFLEYRGISLIKRLNDLRLKRACSLLVHSRIPIKQIAGLSGFKDEYYFSAVFRRCHQMPPGAYRDKNQSVVNEE